jgi:ubiquinone/menaquinone biosynthesis C-methylase UbiE
MSYVFNPEVDEALKRGDLLSLDLGCGPVDKKLQGFFGVDNDTSLMPDIVCDLDNQPLPLPDNSVRQVYACYILEHLTKVMDLMQEIWRVCVPGAIVVIIVPHYAWDGQHKDPTHKTTFSPQSWEYWDARHGAVPHYGFECEFDLVNLQFRFAEGWTSKPKEEIEFAMKHYRNVIENMTFTLTVVK